MDTHGLEPALRDVLRETLDLERGPHPEWAGSPAARRVAEHQRTRWPLRSLAAAAVLVVAVVGYNLLPGLGIVGPGARLSPAPAPSVLAGDGWIDHDWGPVEFEATLDGSSVTGQMTMGRADETGHLVVNLQCARTREDGLIALGGYITSGSGRWPEGTLAGIVLPGGVREQLSSKLAGIWVGVARNVPETETTDCLEYLDAQLLISEPFPWFDYRYP